MQQTHQTRTIVILSLILIFSIAGMFACSTQSGASGKVAVVTTFYPLGYFAEQVGGDRVAVTDLVQPGVEPHDFDPTPLAVRAIVSAKVFVYNGAGLEGWAQKVLDSEKPKGVVVMASQGLDLMNDEEDPTAQNPHVWLDPVLAQQQVKNIRDGLIKADAEGKATYEANATKLLNKLEALDQQITAGLKTCQTRTFVVSHDATAYFSKRYGLQSLSITGLSPDAEPDPKTLSELSKTMREKKLKYVFTETLVSPALAQTLAKEAGAQRLTFNPVEGLTKDEITAGKDYISVMKDNLKNLRTGLGCS